MKNRMLSIVLLLFTAFGVSQSHFRLSAVKTGVYKLAMSFLLLVVTFNAMGQNETIRIKSDDVIRDSKTENKLDGVQIVVFENGVQKALQDAGNTGKFDFTLPLGYTYELEFSKRGYVSKILSINTENIPPADRAGGFTIEMSVTLFTYVKGFNTAIMKDPMAKASFEPQISSISFDYNYTASMQRKIDAEFKRLEELKKAQCANSPDFVVSCSNIMILYRGIENHINIINPAVSPEDLVVQCEGGEIAGSCGFYTVIPGNGTDLSLIISRVVGDTLEYLDTKQYLIKNLPYPETALSLYQDYLNGDKITAYDLSSGLEFNNAMISSKFVDTKPDVTCSLRGFPVGLDIQVHLVSCKLQINSKDCGEVVNGYFSEEQEELLKKVVPGDVIFIHNVSTNRGGGHSMEFVIQ
jgi:hypothetical protein